MSSMHFCVHGCWPVQCSKCAYTLALCPGPRSEDVVYLEEIRTRPVTHPMTSSCTPSSLAIIDPAAHLQVNVSVNGKLIPFNMKIGDAGEAFFVFETEGEVPDDLITSPLLEPTKPGEASTHVDEGSRFGAKDTYRDADGAPQRAEEAVQEPDFLDLNASNTPDSSIPAPEPPSPRSKIGPSGLSLLKPVSDERDYPESGEPPTFLVRTAGLGKAVVDAIVETEKEKSAQLKDSLIAARDLTQSITTSRNEHNDPLHVDTPQDKGDEILPKVKTEDLEAPDVLNNGGKCTSISYAFLSQRASGIRCHDRHGRLSFSTYGPST